MKVRNPIPNNEIADYVTRILVIENDQITTPFILPLYANGFSTILFKSVKAKLGNNTSNHLTLLDQTVLPQSLTLNDDFTLIAYFFKPYTLISLFGVQSQELTVKPIDLNLLSPQKTIQLQEKLLNADTFEDMIALLDSFIFWLINKSKTKCLLLKYATTQIANNPSKESLLVVQKQLHITERSLQRLFERNIVVPPNLYRRICQFNSAFIPLNKRNYHKLSGIAFQNGYSAQSHYIRSFKEFTNITPAAYLKFGSEE